MMTLRVPPKYVLASILCSFGGFLFGMDTGIIGPVTVMNSYVASLGSVSSTVHGLIVSTILIPAAISSFFAGKVADILGRPKAISLGAFIFGLGAALEAGAADLAMFIVGRCVEGIGEGLYLGTLVVYICEISPPSKRGPLTSAPQLLITMGLCVGFFICYGSTNIGSSLSWRLPFAILSVLAFSFSLASLWLTPSPRWLTLHGRTAEAAAAWDILGVSHAEREKIEIVENIREITESGETNASRAATPQDTLHGAKKRNNFWELFSHDVRDRTFLAVFMMGMQQLSGIDGVLYYAPLLFQQAGLSSSEASFLASGVSALVIFGVTIPALIWADGWGRRHSTIYGGIGLGIIMFLIGGLYAGTAVDNDSGAGRWVVIVSIYLFAMLYSLSWGVGIKIYAAEIQPQRTRAAATSLAHGSNWSANFLVALTTPILLANSSYGAYFLFGGCSLLTALVCSIFMPETRGRSLEEIEEAFKKTSVSKRLAKAVQKTLGRAAL